MKHTPIMAVKPTGEEVQLAQVVTTPPALNELAMASPSTTKLPATASTLPLFGLLGIMALGAAAAIRAIANRIS